MMNKNGFSKSFCFAFRTSHFALAFCALLAPAIALGATKAQQPEPLNVFKTEEPKKDEKKDEKAPAKAAATGATTGAATGATTGAATGATTTPTPAETSP